MAWCTKIFCLSLFAAVLCSAASVSAQENQVSSMATSVAASPVPRLIKFTGTLFDEQGRPMKSPVGVTFALYAQQSGSAALWMETQNIELDAEGDYMVLLGATSAHGVPVELFATGEARWLGVQAERQPEQPRVLLVSVPYALKAGDAQTLGGLPASAFAPAGSLASNSASPSSAPAMTLLAPSLATTAASLATISGTGTTNFVPLWTPNGSTLGNSILFQSTASNVNVNGSFSFPATGTATSTAGFNSQPLDFLASAFNDSPLPGTAVNERFRWQAEPVGNNTAAPAGKLNLLFASGATSPAETGLSISNKGIIAFAPGQTMPTISGNETVSGNFTASGSVSGAGASFTGNVSTGAQTIKGNITDTGNISATGSLTSADLNLPNTTSATVGVISLGGAPFAHNFGTDNTFLGQNAGNFKTSGNRNTAVGVSALQNNTTGSFNASSGFGSLFSNNTGSFNTAMGENALLFNTGGSNNTATGLAALYRNTTGSNNTALGVGAGLTATSPNANVTGSNNTFIGYQAGPGTATQLTNATAIGANALVSGNNALVLGGTAANAVNVGIGTTTPFTALHVSGFGDTEMSVESKAAGGRRWTIQSSASGGLAGVFQIIDRSAGMSRLSVNTVGNVGIGTTAPSFALHVNGVVRSETGLSLGGNAPIAVDAPFINGGRFVVLANGNVGINKPIPTATLDVSGTVNIEGVNATLNVGAPGGPSGQFTVQPNGNVGINLNQLPAAALDVAGSVRINGDIPMSSNPHMSFSAFQLGSLCGGNLKCGGGTAVRGGAFVPDKDILITRMTLSIGSPIDPSCGSAHADILNGLGGPTLLTVALPPNVVYTDSGHEEIDVSAGTFLIFTAVVDNSDNCSAGASAGGDVFANIQYMMQ